MADADEQILVDDRVTHHQQRICGGQTDRQYADERNTIIKIRASRPCVPAMLHIYGITSSVSELSDFRYSSRVLPDR